MEKPPMKLSLTHHPLMIIFECSDAYAMHISFKGGRINLGSEVEGASLSGIHMERKDGRFTILKPETYM